MNPSASFIYNDYDIAIRVGHGASEATLTDMVTGRVAARASLPTTSVEAAISLVRDFIDEQGHKLGQSNDYHGVAEHSIKGMSDDEVRALIKAFRRYSTPEYQAQADALESALNARQKTSAVQYTWLGDDIWVSDAWDGKGEVAALVDKLFDTGEIPAQGAASEAAEPLRLFARINYDAYNNGWGNNRSMEFGGLESLLDSEGARITAEIADHMHRDDSSSRALAERLDALGVKCMEYYYAHGGQTKVGKTASYTLPLGAPFDTPGIVDSADQARDIAIEWQYWVGEQNLSYDEFANWEGYFESLVEQFPELRDEFIENAIIGGEVTAKRAQTSVPAQFRTDLTKTHHQYAQEQSLGRPCSIHDLTFGGVCMNCGYDPEMFVPERPQIVPGGGFRMGMKTSSRKRAQWKTAYSTEDKIDLEYARLNNFKFIGIYLVSRHYGGPEEGGWWYDWSDHVRSLPLGSITQEQLLEEMKKAAREMGANVQYDRFSVLGNDGDIIWAYEERPGEWQSNETPRYE